MEMCALMWRLLTWCNKFMITLRARHVPGSLNVIADALSRKGQVQTTEWSLSPQIFKRIAKIWEYPQVDLFATSKNKKLPTYVSPIPDPEAWAVDSLNISWDNMVAYAFPPTALLPRIIQKLQSQLCRLILIAPGWPTKRPTQTTSSNTVTTQTTIEPSVPQPTGVPESPRVVSRSSALQAQGFSAEVADRIAAPQRLSTRRIYENKWMVFSKWCTQKQVDVRSPSIKDICDFLCYLFTDLNRRPSTIEGYRTALADRLESTGLCISANLEVSRLIASFHRNNPKCARMIPKWNLSLVLHQLTLAPFEPMEEASLKFLTWKTVFLLTLASGKRRSEIHAWTLKGLLSLGDWDQVQLSPSPSFIAKNQLARDGPASIAPVVIPALSEASTTNQSDILLCPIRILRHYLARTGELRTDQKLLFISFKPGFNKDIRPSTVSSWIKKTILYCYSKIEDADLDAINVKAHDVRAFAASKAFQTGVSMDQIMSACHWKSQNTFTKFYLKDLSGKDQKDHNYHLRSFVAAQQVVTAP